MRDKVHVGAFFTFMMENSIYGRGAWLRKRIVLRSTKTSSRGAYASGETHGLDCVREPMAGSIACSDELVVTHKRCILAPNLSGGMTLDAAGRAAIQVRGVDAKQEELVIVSS